MALRHNQLLCHAVQIVALTYELLASDRQARRGRIHTLRGSIETPVFMPVGTRGAVIHLDQRDYSELDIEVVLGNTYNLILYLIQISEPTRTERISYARGRV